MTIKEELNNRSGGKCELCGSKTQLSKYDVPPINARTADKSVLTCANCFDQINHPEKVNVNHWRCLNDCMWSEVPAVQVMSWRMLNRMRGEGWPQDLLDMMYMDDETLLWAKQAGENSLDTLEAKHLDSNGTELQSGDTVTLIKSLDVKGANLIAKRGTAVRNIKLVSDNPEHIEGKVNGQQIVILTKFVKKSN